MDLILTLLSIISLFVGGWFLGATSNPIPEPKEIIEIVYEKDCYIEFEDREYKVKRLSIDDLK